MVFPNDPYPGLLVFLSISVPQAFSSLIPRTFPDPGTGVSGRAMCISCPLLIRVCQLVHPIRRARIWCPSRQTKRCCSDLYRVWGSPCRDIGIRKEDSASCGWDAPVTVPRAPAHECRWVSCLAPVFRQLPDGDGLYPLSSWRPDSSPGILNAFALEVQSSSWQAEFALFYDFGEARIPLLI